MMAKDTWQVFWNLGAGCMMAAGRTAFHNISDKVKESHKSTRFSLLALKCRIRADAHRSKLTESIFTKQENK